MVTITLNGKEVKAEDVELTQNIIDFIASAIEN